LDLAQLETFLTVAQEGSFSRAAKKLFRTQPAVSLVIRKLEDEIGESLFDRSARDGMLTDAGSGPGGIRPEAAEHPRRGAWRRSRSCATPSAARLSIGANEVTCLYLLPLLHEFRRNYPRVHIAVQRTLASKLPDAVLDHTVELGILTYRPENTGLRSVVVYRDELVFVVPPAHPLAGSGEVNMKDLGSECFVAHNVPSPYRHKVLEAFQKRRIPLHMDIELPTTEAIKKFVGMENGVALIPHITVQTELDRGELIGLKIRDMNFERKLRIVFRRGAQQSHAAQAFLNVAKAIAGGSGGNYLFKEE
jgi:DNA-binding transcriptional LysR family regulator